LNDESAAERGTPRIPYFHGWSKSGRSPRDCETRLRRRREHRPRSARRASANYKPLHHRHARRTTIGQGQRRHDVQRRCSKDVTTDATRRTSIGQGNGVTTCNAVAVKTSPPMQRRCSRPENSIGEVSAAGRGSPVVGSALPPVVDRDIELAALEETRFHPNSLIGEDFPSRHSSRPCFGRTSLVKEAEGPAVTLNTVTRRPSKNSCRCP
jgi:hypothetical protein